MGVALITWASEHVTGCLLIVMGVILLIRSYIQFRHRLRMIQNREEGYFEDSNGPFMLILMLVFGMVLFLLYVSGIIGSGIIPGGHQTPIHTSHSTSNIEGATKSLPVN
eukprot:859855_1